MNEPAWLVEARRHIGTKEIPGLKHEPKILSWWKAIKRGGIKTDEVPWCSAFVGACLEHVGIISSRFESARSYLTWGVPLKTPVLGCIAVLARAGGGHVFFVTADAGDGRLLGIGGNQKNKVSLSTFDKNRVLGYRWPKAVPIPTEPLRIIGSAQRSSENEA